MTSTLMEATDKTKFLEWLSAESIIDFGADPKLEISRICQRWIRLKIRQAGN